MGKKKLKNIMHNLDHNIIIRTVLGYSFDRRPLYKRSQLPKKYKNRTIWKLGSF